MQADRTDVLESIRVIRQAFSKKMTIGLLTGTGLSDALAGITEICRFDYAELPGFPVSTVKGHHGRLIIGRHNGRHILIMQGRFHLYEGYTPRQVAFPVRVMQELGVNTLIITNAAGGINLSYSPGDIMIIRDHVNLTGRNPLTGPNETAWGIRFPDMTRVYDAGLRRLAKSLANDCRVRVHQGVYAGLQGPSLETPAEINFLKTIGSDAVGMSTVMEAIAGVHAGMNILGLSLITNINDPDHPEPATLEGVIETAEKSLPGLNRLLLGILPNLPKPS